MMRPYFMIFKLLPGSQLALSNSEIFASSHSDNLELPVGVVEVENRMQSGHRQTETAVHVLRI
jgi:hypothetical protein